MSNSGAHLGGYQGAANNGFDAAEPFTGYSGYAWRLAKRLPRGEHGRPPVFTCARGLYNVCSFLPPAIQALRTPCAGVVAG